MEWKELFCAPKQESRSLWHIEVNKITTITLITFKKDIRAQYLDCTIMMHRNNHTGKLGTYDEDESRLILLGNVS